MKDLLEALQSTPDPAWLLEEHDYIPRNEAAAESRFAIGNGFLGVRGAREVGRGPSWASWGQNLIWSSWPRSYVAGLFDTPNVSPPVPWLVPVPDWLRVRIRINDQPLRLDSGTLLAHRRTLDLKRGLLLIDWRQRTVDGAVVRVRSLRLVSQSCREVGLHLLWLDIEDGGADLMLDATFDQGGMGLEPVRFRPEFGVWRTEQSRQEMAMAGSADLQIDRQELAPETQGPLAWTWRWNGSPGQAVAFERIVAVARGEHPESRAVASLARARASGWHQVLTDHVAAWAARWHDGDVVVEGDPEAQLALRFAVYHLICAANPEDERVSIGARGLTGDGYLGHVFWDTEIYLLPFYTATWPEAARALLMYRFHTLGGARAKARHMGCRGACYAWESADTGEEVTPEHVLDYRGEPVEVLCGRQELHITSDVAYAVWQYWRTTADTGFLRTAGAEIVFETARFWASRAILEADGRRHIRGVIGPDEYHETIDDNVTTNRLARWNLRRGVEVADLLRARWPDDWTRLASDLSLDDAELALWAEAAAALVDGGTPADGVLEQFTGYFALEDIDLSQFPGRTAPMDVVLGRERIHGSQIVKQADVVALLAMLPEEFDAAAALANFRHYQPRCGQDSSLSRPMHALVAARLGETTLALRYFRETAATDLDATTESAAGGGVRMAALGGLWMAVVFGFAGLSFEEDGLALAPKLPEVWTSLSFRVRWRGRRVRLHIARPDVVTARLEEGPALVVRVGGRIIPLDAF